LRRAEAKITPLYVGRHSLVRPRLINGHRFESSLANIFTLQHQMTASVVSAVRPCTTVADAD